MATQVPTPTVVNGLDMSTLGGLVNLLKEHPEGGQVTFLSRSHWQHGARVLTRFSGYKIDEQMYHNTERRFVELSDEPTEMSGTDAAPGPVEQLMHAVGSCVLATTNANAAFMGVNLTRLEATLESKLDLHGMFALDETVRPGIGEMRATITIAGDADEETLRAIATRGFRYSPVRESVQEGVTVHPEIVVE